MMYAKLALRNVRRTARDYLIYVVTLVLSVGMFYGFFSLVRLIASWGCSRSQGLGCSPIKAVRELGSERRETVRSLSVVGAGNLRGAVLSTRGPGWTYLWCTGCRPTAQPGSYVWNG